MSNKFVVKVPVNNTPKKLLDFWSNSMDNDDTDTLYLDDTGTYIANARDKLEVIAIQREGGSFFLHVSGNEVHYIDYAYCTVDENFLVADFRVAYDNYLFDQAFSNQPTLQVMDKPLIGVGAVLWRLNDNNLEFLMARRIKGPREYINRLSNFGGAVDLGEYLREALDREIKEETGLDITKAEFLAKIHTDETMQKRTDREKVYHAISHTFFVKVPEDQTPVNNEPEKCRNFGWYGLDHFRENEEDFTQLAQESIRTFMIMNNIKF